ncbi:hypothetical protein FQZ97_1131110 [compost metagenome]
MAVLDHTDDIAYPKGLTVSPDHPVVQAVVAARCGLAVAVGLSPERVLRVQDTAPETGPEPVTQWVAEQIFGMG